MNDANGPGTGRATKRLSLAADLSAHQREWFEGVQAAVAKEAPFALVNADAPQEIFRVLDIPFVVIQWWSSLVAAKQLAPAYLARLEVLGYPGSLETYTALAFASLFTDGPDPTAPWGGLPHPTILEAINTGDATRKLFEAWAAHSGADLLLLERSSSWTEDIRPEWWELGPDRWEELIEADRLELMSAELSELIRFLEQRTGRQWSEERLRTVLDLVNRQEESYARTRDLVAAARPAPVSIADTMQATMIPQWHRGTVWGCEAAERLEAEVRELIERGAGCCPDECVRLMWLGRGLWFNTAFYEAFQESHGAVFVWSMYLALAADGYIRRMPSGGSPLRALAARFVMGDELRSPTWASQWHIKEARSHGIDGVVSLEPVSYFDRLAFAQQRIPVLELEASNVDPSGWDEARMRALVASFIEREVEPIAAGRRAREDADSGGH